MILKNSTFNSILIIGAAGATGQLYTQTISQNISNIRIEILVIEEQVKKFSKIFPKSVSVSSSLKSSLKNQPEAIILATANPIGEILEEIHTDLKAPTTLILPQNGVDAVQTAQEIFKNKSYPVDLVRVSLFMTVSFDKNGEAVYDSKKLRIAIAPIYSNVIARNPPLSPFMKGEIRYSPPLLKGGWGDFNVQLTKTLFEQAGFQVKQFADYKPMEWTKLITNVLGSTAAITGLTPKETFTDEELFTLEAKALKERLEILEAAGIPFADIRWHKIFLLPKVKYLPINLLKTFRSQFADIIASGRNNEPPAAARKIAAHKPTEIKYYHQPFIDLALYHGLRSIIDEVIIEINSEYESGKINLSLMNSDEKKELLLKTYDKFLQKPLIPRNPLETLIVEKITAFFSKNLTVSGMENLDSIRESLGNGKSIIFLANHTSHADHPLLVRSLKQSGFPDLAHRLIFISGMKLEREFLGRIFSDAYPRILVSTPSSDIQTEEESRKSQLINLKGFAEINRILNQGNLLVIYAEGTRSRNKKLLKAIPSVARYFENPNIDYLIPVGIQGAGDLLPVGSKIPRFANAKVTFGHPIATSALFEDVLKYLPDNMKNSDKKDKNVRAKINEIVIDHVMKRIAALLPQELRGFYA